MNGVTPSQTIGPFAAPALTPNEKGKANYNWSQLMAGDLVTTDAVGERIRIEGRDARRQRRADGRHPVRDLAGGRAGALRACARSTPAELIVQGIRPGRDRRGGSFVFDTVKPGRVPGPNGTLQAPHVVVRSICAASCGSCSRGFISRTKPRMPRIRSSSWCRQIVARPSSPGVTRQAGLPHRFPYSGRPRDGVLRYLRLRGNI